MSISGLCICRRRKCEKIQGDVEPLMCIPSLWLHNGGFTLYLIRDAGFVDPHLWFPLWRRAAEWRFLSQGWIKNVINIQKILIFIWAELKTLSSVSSYSWHLLISNQSSCESVLCVGVNVHKWVVLTLSMYQLTPIYFSSCYEKGVILLIVLLCNFLLVSLP